MCANQYDEACHHVAFEKSFAKQSASSTGLLRPPHHHSPAWLHAFSKITNMFRSGATFQALCILYKAAFAASNCPQVEIKSSHQDDSDSRQSAFRHFEAECERFGIDAPSYHPVHKPVDNADEELDVRQYQAAIDKLCKLRNERYNGHVNLRKLNSIRGRKNCTSLSVQTLAEHICKDHSLVLDIRDDADTQLPILMEKKYNPLS